MVFRIMKNEWLFLFALVVLHACMWWLGLSLPVLDTHWMLLLSALIMAFPAVVCTFYHFVVQKGRFLSFRAICLCQIVPVAVGVLVSVFWYSQKNYYVPAYLDGVIIAVTAVINLVSGCLLALIYTGLRVLFSEK